MISDKPVISIKVSAIYDNDRLVNYEVIEEHRTIILFNRSSLISRT